MNKNASIHFYFVRIIYLLWTCFFLPIELWGNEEISCHELYIFARNWSSFYVGLMHLVHRFADIISRKRKWPSISYRFAVESHCGRTAVPPAWPVSGQSQVPLETQVWDGENRDVEWLCGGNRETDSAEEMRVTEKREEDSLFEPRGVRSYFMGSLQATLSFYFPLFKCQGKLTKTSRGATTLFPASAKHDASNEFLGGAVIFADSVVFVAIVDVVDVPFNDQ